MKYISKKEFRATRKVEYPSDVEKRLGLMTGDVAGDYVYTYIDGTIYISVIKGPEYQYQVLARDNKTFKTLKKAEKYLYKCLKEDRMEEEINSQDLIEVIHEIASFIGFNASRYKRGQKILQGNESVDEFIDKNSTYDRINFVENMAKEFLNKRKTLSQEEIENSDFLDDIDAFCSEMFPSETKEIEVVKAIGYIDYLTVEFINNLRERNSEEYEKLNGFCGATTKANELVAKFKKEYEGAEWGANGFDSMPNELECFLEREFGMAEKKEFQVVKKVLVTKYVHVEAYTEKEAEKLGTDAINNQEYLEAIEDLQSLEVNKLE